MNHWASELLDVLWRGRAPAGGAAPGELLLGRVTGTAPLTVSVGGVPIAKSLYVNPAALVEAARPDRLGQIFSEARELLAQRPELSPGLAGLLGFLEQYHQAAVLRVGDLVSLVRVGGGFYIQEKVVQAL